MTGLGARPAHRGATGGCPPGHWIFGGRPRDPRAAMPGAVTGPRWPADTDFFAYWDKEI